jgi:hypothetical protein
MNQIDLDTEYKGKAGRPTKGGLIYTILMRSVTYSRPSSSDLNSEERTSSKDTYKSNDPTVT